MAVPILPGKTEQWVRFTDEINGARRAEFEASRRRLGVRERVFLQSTPRGDVTVVVWEGNDPSGAFSRLGSGTDEFTRWFVQQVKEIHGMDLTKPGEWPMPCLTIDSEPAGRAKAA